MAYRRTDNVVRRLAARREAILAAGEALAAAGGMAAVQIAPVAERAAIAAGTVYRYFPSKTDLVAALVTAVAARELAALRKAAGAAPGPVSALAAAITTFAARALAQRKLAWAVLAEPIDAEADAARLGYREALVSEIAMRIAAAKAGGHLPDQDPALSAPALVGALLEGLIGPLAPAGAADPGKARATVQALTLFALRGLGVIDARARGLVVQTLVPAFSPPAMEPG
jgi:AcrR family transcriptional regulator